MLELLTSYEKNQLTDILLQKEKEKVAPKLEIWRNAARYKVCCGGRGAGAKSMTAASLLVQKLNYNKMKWFCGREIQKTLEESSYILILETIERLGYRGWEGIPSRSRIVNNINGSYFYFAGLKDEKKAKGLKGLQDYHGAWIDEAENITDEIWDQIIPTFRRDDSEIWITFNREKEMDPVYRRFFIKPPPGTIAIELLPGLQDNPWFPKILQEQMEHDYKTRPDIAEHKWGGKPKSQGYNAVLSRVAIRAAMNRKLPAQGPLSCGVDVARFGDDRSVIYLRQGMKIVKEKVVHGYDTIQVSNAVSDMIGRDITIPIKIDVGYNPGVADVLKNKGYRVIEISFGSRAVKSNLYKNLITEMWFELPINEIDIPDDDELMDELSERLYDYDSRTEVKVIESKDKFKERYKKSPDKADALLLCFYTGKTIDYTPEARAALAARRSK